MRAERIAKEKAQAVVAVSLLLTLNKNFDLVLNKKCN